MICKKCGFEYVDGLKECPNCQAPNLPEEAKVLSKEERDTFDGITIENTPEAGSDGFKVYDKEEAREETEAEQEEKVKFFSLGGTSLLWQLLFIIIIIGIFFFALPVVAVFVIIAAACYYLYSWLF